MYVFYIRFLIIRGADTPVLKDSLVYAEDIDEAIEFLEDEHDVYKVLTASKRRPGILV